MESCSAAEAMNSESPEMESETVKSKKKVLYM